MTAKLKSALLVGGQLACLVYLFVTGLWLARPAWVWIEIIGLYVGAWAVYTMRLRNLHIGPGVAPGARLVTAGPYRFVRHPMYAALLLITLSLVLSRFTTTRLAVWAALLVVLLAKLQYEETLLARRFPEYSGYRKRTKRLIPLVY